MAAQPMEEKGARTNPCAQNSQAHYEGSNWAGTGEAKRHPAIKAGNTVATPSGDIGTIKSERNGKALVDIDGKCVRKMRTI